MNFPHTSKYSKYLGYLEVPMGTSKYLLGTSRYRLGTSGTSRYLVYFFSRGGGQRDVMVISKDIRIFLSHCNIRKRRESFYYYFKRGSNAIRLLRIAGRILRIPYTRQMRR